MKLNCISCGHFMILDDSYEDYEGLIKCNVCACLLQVKNCDGKIKAVNFACAANKADQIPSNSTGAVAVDSVRPA